MTTKKNSLFIVKNLIFVVFVVFCVQFTELKIDVIKASEIALLLLTPFLYVKKINKWILMLLALFIAWFIITICLNYSRSFYLLENVSVLKTPYVISIGRFLELISCVNLTALVYLFFKGKSKEDIQQYIKYMYDFSFIILMVNVVIYILYMSDFIAETRMVYWGDRLRGWFGEGGPYGLMLAFTFCLSFFYTNKYHFLTRTIIVLVIVFLADSKAGFMLVLIWFAIHYYRKIYKSLRELNIIVLIIGGLFLSFVLSKLAKHYISDINNIKREIAERPTDINLIMGRIAGVYIFPEMIKDYPAMGIGLGNYPIMRNNPEYLGVIPRSPSGETDAHGFGGLMQLLVDGGFFVFFAFMYIVYRFYRKIRPLNQGLEKFLFIFLCFFMFGVQLYFLYPWVLFGILISLGSKQELHE